LRAIQHVHQGSTLRDAFNAGKRGLQDYEKVTRGAVKARVARSVPGEASAS
jgi:hypothetical protein